MARVEERSARQWALRALGRRMHTAYEIRAGLAKRGFPDQAVGTVVAELEKAGYINDLDYARIWVKSRSANQMHGRLRILRDLKLKGVPEDIVDSVIKDVFPHEDEVDIAIKAAEKKRRTMRSLGKSEGRAGRDAIYRYLRSRGFAAAAISAALAGMSSRIEEDPI